MARVLIIAYNPEEASARAARLRGEGIDAEHYPARGTGGLRNLRAHLPEAIAIDLMELPSYGRYMGALLRQQKATRHIPLIFIEGDPEKTPRAKELFPDAVFTSWKRFSAALERAIRLIPVEPVVPNLFTSPLLEKLRIREGTAIALLHAPEGFAKTLGDLPAGCRIARRMPENGVILLFVRSAAALGHELPMIARELRSGRVFWILWPKRSAKGPADLKMPAIRQMAAGWGLVDYKVCAVDETWSGMAIGRRRAQSARA